MLSTLNFWWVTEVLDRKQPEHDPVIIPPSVAPLISAFSEGETVAVAWLRVEGRQPLEVLVGGDKSIGSRAQASGAGDRGRLIYPLGGYGQRRERAAVEATLARFSHWTRCGIVHSIRLDARRDDGQHKAKTETNFEDYVAHLHATPFAWLVVGVPVAQAVIGAEVQTLEREIRVLAEDRDSSPRNRVILEGYERRLRELIQARWQGLWTMHVLVGSVGEEETRRVAALLSAGMDIRDSDYALVPGRSCAPFDRCRLDTTQGDHQHGASPFHVTSEILARVAQLPRRELSGIRLVTPHTFDVTPEQSGQLVLGEVLDANLTEVGAFRVPHATLNRHTFVCGAPGAGKSQTVRSILEHLATGSEPIPWLVIEPAKAEYARMSGRLGPRYPVLVIRPGDLNAPPGSINPLEPEPGFPLQSHLDLVRELFLAAFESDEPFPQVLARALTECYTAAGWDLVSSRQRPAHKPKFFADDPDRPVRARYPTLGELQVAARRVVNNIGYGEEVKANVRGFVDVRIGSLRGGRPGRFFEGGHPLDIGALLAGNVVLELETITNDQDKAFLIGAVLIRIIEHLRVNYGNTGPHKLRHLTVIEEAHRLLKNVHEGPAAAAVELFAALLAEIRAYGEGVLVVEQIPAKILPDVLKNTALKVMHRLPAADDRKAVGATMNLKDDQSEAVVALLPGIAAVTVDGSDRPLLVRMQPGEARESADGCRTYPPLSGRRSILCGRDCRVRACMLGQMNDAEHQSREPALVVWVEAVAASLAIGLEPPAPRAVVRSLLPSPRRDGDCLLAYAADRAVSARRVWLQLTVDPDDFAQQLFAILADLVADRSPRYDRKWFRGGMYRWSDILGTLRAAVASAGGLEAAGELAPHQLTAAWARRGLSLDAQSLAGQMQELLDDPSYAKGGEQVAVGDTDATGLRSAVVTMTGGITRDHAARALRRTCTGNDLEPLVSQIADMLES